MKKNLSKILLLIIYARFLSFKCKCEFSIIDPTTSSKLRAISLFMLILQLHQVLQSEIQQYKADVEAEGYTVKIYNWTDSIPILFNELSPYIRIFLRNITTYGLNGTVLVGEMPFAIYEQSLGVDYICDLYFMDMDGCWQNPDGDLRF